MIACVTVWAGKFAGEQWGPRRFRAPLLPVFGARHGTEKLEKAPVRTQSQTSQQDPAQHDYREKQATVADEAPGAPIRRPVVDVPVEKACSDP